MEIPAEAKTLAQGYGVASRSDPRWIRLRELIQKYSVKTGSFKLSSGRTSRFLFQLRQTTLHPEGAALMADIIVDYMKKQDLHYIGGLVQGAVPIVASVTAVSFNRNAPVYAFFVRKETKQHGAKERIDGHIESGAEVLLVDDVATTGGSLLKALEGVEEEGHKCVARKALVIIDREEGAAENLAEKGIELVSIFKKSDFELGVSD